MAKIVDFGTAARISDDHGPYTLNWLRCQTQTPGTNGYSVGFNEYHKYFCKQSVEALTDIHKIFLRHMDLFSFSAVIEECSRHFLENHHIMTTQGSNEVDVNYILTYVTKELRTLCRVLRNRDHVEEDHVGVFRATVTSANDLIRDNGLPLFFLSDTRTSLDIFCNV